MSEAWVKWCKKRQKEGVKIEWNNYMWCNGEWNFSVGGKEEYRVPAQPIPEGLKDWRQWCLDRQAEGVMFEVAGLKKWEEGAYKKSFNKNKHLYRIAAQPVPALEDERNSASTNIKEKENE